MIDSEARPVGAALNRDTEGSDYNARANFEAEVWAQSERRREEQRRAQNRAEWHLFHTDQAERHRRTLERLISYHEEQAAKVLVVKSDVT